MPREAPVHDAGVNGADFVHQGGRTTATSFGKEWCCGATLRQHSYYHISRTA